jgi:hypothetical protein
VHRCAVPRRCYVLADLAVKVMLSACVDNRGANLARLSIEQAEYNRFTFWSTSVDLFRALVSVHIARLVTDETLISLNSSGHLVDAASVLRIPDAVEHEPRGFLRHFQRAAYFVAHTPFLQFASIHIAQSHLSSPIAESSKIVPTLTKYCFLQSRHFHMRRVLRKDDFLLEQRGHTASPFGHFTDATSWIHVSGLL